MKSITIKLLMLTSLIFFQYRVSGQTVKDSLPAVVKSETLSKSKEEKNRNVMLNADGNTGPRNVNIGLPFQGDIIIGIATKKWRLFTLLIFHFAGVIIPFRLVFCIQ